MLTVTDSVKSRLQRVHSKVAQQIKVMESEHERGWSERVCWLGAVESLDLWRGEAARGVTVTPWSPGGALGPPPPRSRRTEDCGPRLIDDAAADRRTSGSETGVYRYNKRP